MNDNESISAMQIATFNEILLTSRAIRRHGETGTNGKCVVFFSSGMSAVMYAIRI